MIEFIAKNQHGESMKNIVMATCLTTCLGFSLPAFSDDGAALYTSRGCIGCHGAGGNAPIAPNYPKIGMQNKEYTVNQLTDFKNNKRSNGLAALMVGMVAALTEENIRKLAEHLSTNTQSSASGPVLADGADLYVEKNCIACHGANGNKPVMNAYPRIGGQSEMYLLAQMKDIKTGARNNSHTLAMKNVMGNISDSEMATIAGWLSKQSQ